LLFKAKVAAPAADMIINWRRVVFIWTPVG